MISALSLMLGISSAHAVLDISETTGALAEIVPAVLAIGVAVLAVVVAIKTYKWIKSAL